MKKWLVLFASAMILLCLGGVYAWSAFIDSLIDKYELSVTQTQIIFGTAICVFTVVMIWSGRLQVRYGPRPVALIGGILLSGGYLVCSFSHGSFALLLIGYGLLGGAGIGFGYVCPIAACVKWFPSSRGSVTGIVVASFGAGAVALSNLAESLLGKGLEVLHVFRVIGITYGVIIVFCSLMLSVPDRKDEKALGATIPLGCILRQKAFYMLTVGMLTGTFGGLMVIGNIKPMGLYAGIDENFAKMAVSVFALGNALGRITWGRISDKIGWKSIPISLVWLILSISALIPATFSSVGFLLVATLVGFGFGSCFVVYVAETVRRYGADAVGSVYPLIMLCYGISGLGGPGVGGWLYDMTGTYTASVLVAALVAIAGLTMVLLLARRLRETVDSEGTTAETNSSRRVAESVGSR